MSDQFELNAEVRTDLGKGASRRLRRLDDRVPAIIYGGDKAPQPLTLIRKDLEKALENEAFYSHVLTINVGKDKEKAILKDLQRHPAKKRVTHVDFMRINDNMAHQGSRADSLPQRRHLPRCENPGRHHPAPGNRHRSPVSAGGIFPQYIEVDMLKVEIGQIIHLSDITLPEGVTSVALALGEDHDLAIASVIAPKGWRRWMYADATEADARRQKAKARTKPLAAARHSVDCNQADCRTGQPR